MTGLPFDELPGDWTAREAVAYVLREVPGADPGVVLLDFGYSADELAAAVLELTAGGA